MGEMFNTRGYGPDSTNGWPCQNSLKALKPVPSLLETVFQESWSVSDQVQAWGGSQSVDMILKFVDRREVESAYLCQSCETNVLLGLSF